METNIGLNFRLTYPISTNFISSREGNQPRIYRSGFFDILNKQEFTIISEQFKIAHWFDMRSRKEKMNKAFSNKAIFVQFRIDYTEFFWDSEDQLPEKPNAIDYMHYYQKLLVNKELLHDVFVCINEALYKGNIVISCFAGKDRTGLICYLIHQILGSSLEDIKNDFVISKDYLIKKREIFIEKAQKKLLTLDEYTKRFALCSEIFDIFHDWFGSKYIDISSFLQELNLQDDFIAEFKNHFLKNGFEIA